MELLELYTSKYKLSPVIVERLSMLLVIIWIHLESLAFQNDMGSPYNGILILHKQQVLYFG